jgi:hypothetical protein
MVFKRTEHSGFCVPRVVGGTPVNDTRPRQEKESLPSPMGTFRAVLMFVEFVNALGEWSSGSTDVNDRALRRHHIHARPTFIAR